MGIERKIEKIKRGLAELNNEECDLYRFVPIAVVRVKRDGEDNDGEILTKAIRKLMRIDPLEDGERICRNVEKRYSSMPISRACAYTVEEDDGHFNVGFYARSRKYPGISH